MNFDYNKISDVLIRLLIALAITWVVFMLASCTESHHLHYHKVIVVDYIGDSCDSGITFHNYKVYNPETKITEFVGLDDIGVFAPNDTIMIN